MSDIDVSSVTEPKLFIPLPHFRAIVPEGTTMEAPKLQQAHRDLKSGEITWRTIQRVVVSRAEFNAA